MTAPVNNNKTWFGFGPPMLANGRFAPFQADARLIKNDVLMLLSTRPGERIMRSRFGARLNDMMFEKATPRIIDNLKNEIFATIARYEQRVSLTPNDISITQSPNDKHVLRVVVTPTLNIEGDQRTVEIEFGIDQDTGAIRPAL